MGILIEIAVGIGGTIFLVSVIAALGVCAVGSFFIGLSQALCGKSS